MRSILLAVALAAAVSGDARACPASFYGSESGNRTANGERFDPMGITAAHRTMPFGTRVRVTLGGKSVVVRINDRGPAAWTGRCIDLSRGAARVIGMERRGVAHVGVEVVRW